MNRSYSKIRHIQEANIRLEKRIIIEKELTNIPQNHRGINNSDFMTDKEDMIKFSNLSEGIFGNLFGAESYTILELTNELKNIYNQLDEYEKPYFKTELDTIANRYGTWDTESGSKKSFSNVLDGGDDWYGTVKDIKKSGSFGMDPYKLFIKYFETTISDLRDKIEKHIKGWAIEKKSKSEIEKYESEYKEVNDYIQNNSKLTDYFVNNWNESILGKIKKILETIPGNPTNANPEKYSLSHNLKELFRFDTLFTSSEEFNKANIIVDEIKLIFSQNKLIERLEELKTTTYDNPHMDMVIEQIRRLSINIELLSKLIEWAKENLKDKKISDLLMASSNYQIITIEDSSSTIAKYDGDGNLTIGNIVYHGNVFNNLSMSSVSDYISKTGGYNASHSGKAMYATTNLAYAFYYLFLRFYLNKLEINGSKFPTLYRITLKPGSKFLLKGDTNVDEDEDKELKLLGISGYHSGNDVVNGQSIEVSIIDPKVIVGVESIPPTEVIGYFESGQFINDNESIATPLLRVDDTAIKWYKSLF
jgi:hypothetical protein